ADAPINDGRIDLLIGCDYLYQLTRTNIKRIPNTSAVAIETVFGWTITGCFGNQASVSDHVRFFNVNTSSISQEIRKFWELDALGIVDEATPKQGAIDPAMFQSTHVKRLKERRYEVSLPWKDNLKPQNNFEIASIRLKSLTKRLSQNEELCYEYHNIIRVYLANGFIEEAEPLLANLYVMPHRCVILTDSSTTKTRIVFDASAHKPGVLSLNDCLHAGPNLNPNLIGVLMNFRTHLIAVTTDVTKAFLQISVDARDREYLRFMWYKEVPIGNASKFPDVVHYRFARVPFGVTSSPFLLAIVLRSVFEKWKNVFPKTVSLLISSTYVDDFLAGASSVAEAKRICYEVRTIFNDAGMSLQKWRSNVPSVLDVGNKADTGDHELYSSNIFKFLGL